MSEYPGFNEDFTDLLQLFVDESVEFLVVGAHAMAAHGLPRATGDLDLFVRPTADNAPRVLKAFVRYGAPIAAHGVTADDFETRGTVYQIGLPPRRIDILTQLSGVSWERAWGEHDEVRVEGAILPVIGPRALIENKRATGRPKDLVDAEHLERRLSKT